MYLGDLYIDEYLSFPANTHNPLTAEATDADRNPIYDVLEDETHVPIKTGAMTPLPDSTSIGFYMERFQLIVGDGFELDKSYTIRMQATVDGVTGTSSHAFRIRTRLDPLLNICTEPRLSQLDEDSNTGIPLDLDNILSQLTTLLGTLGALTDVAADGDPTSVDTVMQYTKQLINTLVGSTGIPTFPSQSPPDDGVSLAAVIRATYTGVTSIALTGATVSTPAKDTPNGFVITFGENEANDEDSTHAADGIYHDIEAQDDGGTEKIDVYYEFDIGGDGIPTSTSLEGYLDRGGGALKNITIQAYNWGTTSWDFIGSLPSGTTDSNETYTLFTTHVGTGANLGVVRIRFVTGTVSFSATTTLKIDQIFLSYAIVRRTVGYALGAIWINTDGSNTNTEIHIDGTADNPVSTLAAALTLSAALTIDKYEVGGGNPITFISSQDGTSYSGEGWTLALGGQSVSGAYIHGAVLSGTCTGPIKPVFEHCRFGTVTIPPTMVRTCGFVGTITLGAAGTYFFDRCHSMVAGPSAPVFDFGAAVGNTEVSFRNYSSGVDIRNMGQTGTDTITLEGNGQLIINANCIGGMIIIRGNFELTDNSGGLVSITQTARFDDHTRLIDIEDDANTLRDICLEERLAQLDDSSIGIPNDLNNILANQDTIVAKLPVGTISDFDETTDPVEILATGGIAGKNAEELIDDFWDELLTGGTHNINNSGGKIIRQLQELQKYNRAVWIDTNNGESGTTNYENGTIDNPVDSIDDARVIAVSLGLTNIEVANGSTITLGDSFNGYNFFGELWTLDLNGQSISGSYFSGASVSGICTGALQPKFVHCELNSMTIPPTHFVYCNLGGTITMGSAGNFFFDQCHSGIAGQSSPVLDYGSSLNASNVNFRLYSGGIDIRNMGAGSGTYNMSLEGFGQLIINANCSATSIIVIRGHFPLTNNAIGMTISQSARFDNYQDILDIEDDTDTLRDICIEDRLSQLDDSSIGIPNDLDNILANQATLPASIWNYLTASMTTVNSIGKKLADWILGTDSKNLISTDVQDLSGSLDTNTKTFTVGLDLTTAMKASVNAECDTAISNAGLATATNVSDVETNIRGANNDDLKDISEQLDTVITKTANLPSGIKQNEAIANFPFTMIDSTDHISGKTGLTITSERRIDGGAFEPCTNSAVEIGNGAYSLNKSAADVNGKTIMFKHTAVDADMLTYTVVTQT